MELLLEVGLNRLIRYTTLKYMKNFQLFFNEHETSVLEILFDVVNLGTYLCSELVYVSFLEGNE